MKKNLLIVVAILFIISVLSVAIAVFFQSKTNTSRVSNPIPLITPSGTQAPLPTFLKPLSVISEIPADKSANVPLNQTIQLTFTTTVSDSDFTFSIRPNVSYTLENHGNQEFITINSLTPNTTYTYTITKNDGSQPQSFSFTTAAQDSPIYKDNAASSAADWNRINQPDLYLYNNVPHTESTFSVTGDYTDQPTGHFFFTVALKGSDKNISKHTFLNWVKSMGITDEQIQRLDITFQ